MATIDLPGHLLIVGGGRMGEAIVGGLAGSGAVPASAIVVAEPSEARRAVFAALEGVRHVAAASDAVDGASVVVLAVKPQIIDDVVTSLAGQLGDALVISIAVGVSTARLESLLPAGTRVVRVMPNTPALVGEGMSVVSGGAEATDPDVALVCALFEQLGRVVVLPEHLQDAAAAISGSGPAYFGVVIDALARAGVRQGLPRDVAQDLAVQTMRGTGALLVQTGQHPEALVDAVASPGGTTIAALEALEAGGLRSSFAEAVAAAVRRAKELA